MGSTLQWRPEPPEHHGRSFGAMIEFGGYRDSGTGYMAYSDRVGPGVVLLSDQTVLEQWILDLADRLNEEGFTVLAPDLSGAANLGPRIRAAAEHLTANWHPRLGVVGFGKGAELACDFCSETATDAVVLYSELGSINSSRMPPLLRLDAPPDTDRWFTEKDLAQPAHEETIEFFHYHLA